MRSRHTLTRAGVVALALGVLVACSGGGSSRLSKPEFIRKAGAVCKASDAEIARLAAPDLSDPAATPNLLRRLIAIQRRELARLRALRGPKSDEPGVERWLGLVGQSLDQSDAAVRALERGDRDGVNRANAKGSSLQSAADAAAREYGVTRCAAPAPPGSAPSSA